MKDEGREVAAFLQLNGGQGFAEVEPRQIVGATLSSGVGFKQVRHWLATNGLLEQAPGGGGGCGT